ncbi:hypothetical protein SOVF_138180, partial [Spinacia oleracea]
MEIYCDGVLVNEALYFLANTKESYTSPCKFIASFDLWTENFSLIDCPSYEDKLSSNLMLSLSELGGCLCLVMNYHNSGIGEFFLNPNLRHDSVLVCAVVWVMKEHGKKDSWIKLFSIHNPNSIRSYLLIKPLIYSKDGQRILLEMDCRGLLWYDLKSNKVDRYTVQGMPNGVFEMAYFMGSLVSLEDKLHPEIETLPRKNMKRKNKNDLGNYLSVG